LIKINPENNDMFYGFFILHFFISSFLHFFISSFLHFFTYLFSFFYFLLALLLVYRKFDFLCFSIYAVFTRKIFYGKFISRLRLVNDVKN